MAEEKVKEPRKKPDSKQGKEAEEKDNIAPTIEQAEAVAEKKTKIKKRVDANGIVTIRATFNNTVVTISDIHGNVVCWSTPGKNGFKGSRKSTPFAAQVAAEAATKSALEKGMKKVEVRVKGAGAGREAAIRSIQATGLEITSIKDITGIPHNGCRPPKRRRV